MKEEQSKISIPIAGWVLPPSEKFKAGPRRRATPAKPPARPNQTIGVGRGAKLHDHDDSQRKPTLSQTSSATLTTSHTATVTRAHRGIYPTGTVSVTTSLLL